MYPIKSILQNHIDRLTRYMAEADADLDFLRKAADRQLPDEDRAEVVQAIQQITEALFCPAGSNVYEIPSGFWQTEIGQILAGAQIWAMDRDLISLTEAAEILFGDQMRSGDLKEKSALRRVISLIQMKMIAEFRDLREPNPMRQRRVLRSEIEARKADDHHARIIKEIQHDGPIDRARRARKIEIVAETKG